LWAAWLFLTWCFFASSHFLNSYYLAALAPPIAALCGMGLAVAWRLRARRVVRAALGATVLIGTAYELYLLPTDAGVRPWIVASTLLLALGALLAVALSAAALLVGSVWAAATVVAAQLGPFDSPYQAASITASDRAVNAASGAIDAGLVRAAAHIAPSVSVITSETSSGSSVPILATGREFLPVGGFTGRVPSPTLRQFVEDVWQGKVAVVLAAVSPRTRNPDMLWAIAHCRHVPYRGPDSKIAGRTMAFFVCSPADVSG
jgi:4-amino-4-deoxy-L-arabinose transferase-like glycosyltransferase